MQCATRSRCLRHLRRSLAQTTGSEELVDEDALLQQLNPEQREQLRRLRAEAQKLRGDSRD